MITRCATLSIFLLAQTAFAQFTPAFLRNASYWTPDRSEFNFYDAEIMMDGQSRKCEALMILTAKAVDRNSFTLGPKEENALPVIELCQYMTIPHGIVNEQISIRALWRLDFTSLARVSFAGTEGLGQSMKTLTENRTGDHVSWHYFADTYFGKVEQPDLAQPDGLALIYDELPLRVRMLDFSKSHGDVDLRLAYFDGPQTDLIFSNAKLSWKIGEREIEVDVKSEPGVDHFVLDRDFPFLLREWRQAEGSRLKLKNSLRLDYRNYLKNGDRERALKDPMLRHPD